MQSFQAQYTELCTRLGDIQYKLDMLQAERSDLILQLKELNRLQSTLLKAAPLNGSEKALKTERID